jgi:inner membrane protein
LDLLTQGLLGGTLALSLASKKEVRQAAVIGFVAGLLADADILIKASNDPLLNVELHRHFTHALIFIPIGALIASFMASDAQAHRIQKNLWLCISGVCH